MLAPLDTVINTFGGRWFDDQWNAQLNSPEVKKAVNFYVDTIKKSGELGASSTGFQECANLFGQGQTAMWYDATSAVSVLEDPKTYPDLVGKIGYLPAPIVEKPNSGWLYTWALGIPKAAKNPDGAWKFISWMTSKDYMKLVGEKLGWARVPPGSRTSTYTELPEYEAISKSYGPLTLQVDHERDAEQADGATGSVHRRAVRRDSRVPGSRHAGEPADQCGHRRTEVGGRRARASTEIRRGRRQDIPGEVMTLTADTESDASQQAVAERVRKIREAQDTGVSRAEGWRRRGTAAARADLHDRRHAGPVPVHAVLLDVVVEPGSSRLAAVRRAEQLHRGGQGQPVLVGGAATPSS